MVSSIQNGAISRYLHSTRRELVRFPEKQNVMKVSPRPLENFRLFALLFLFVASLALLTYGLRNELLTVLYG